MKKTRKIVVENANMGHAQVDVFYDESDPEGLQEAIWSAIQDTGGISFEKIEGETSYAGWRRMVINISPPQCLEDDCYGRLEIPVELEAGICLSCIEGWDTGGEDECA